MSAFRLLLIVLGLSGAGSAPAGDLLSLMPRPEDHTQMWWAEGFPGNLPEARWLRVVQTGSYAMVLDTEAMSLRHLGELAGPGEDWRQLPAADLALRMVVDGKPYRCTAGGPWTRFTGPRLVESGRFFQRGDVTDLVFTAEDGSRLNADARFETAAWSDRLAMTLAVRPGKRLVVAGEASFGRVRGGFGLDGANYLEIRHRPELDPERFTLELWAFVPSDYQASDRVSPWLVCKNRNEVVDGNFGIYLARDGPQARLNIGGGPANAVTLKATKKHQLNMNAWNHLAISYDGDVLRLYLNGAWAGETKIGKKRVPGRDGLAIGRRQDGSGDGYHFRGVVDEVRLYDRALTLEELRLRWNKPEAERPELKPVGEWTFNPSGTASMTRLREEWKSADMQIELASRQGKLQQRVERPQGSDWQEVSLVFDPRSLAAAEKSPVVVNASEFGTGKVRPVDFDATLGWHRVNLDGIEPIAPPGGKNPSNDAIERVKLKLSNPTDHEQIARLMFEKTARGFLQRIGTPITGVSAVLRDQDGNPTGIPVQLSKNWHNEPEGGVYAGQWFHGISQVRLPAKVEVELELVLAYGHWGGVAAASHAQLCLIGWGSNQLWDQSALGAWGESICYEPDQAQRGNTITDVRPLMVRAMGEGKSWGWTNNVGGGDFLRCFDSAGNRIAHAAMRTMYHRQGPCLTEVTYAGRVGAGMSHSTTVSLGRSDDLTRGVYRIRMDVTAAMDFSRFVIFQIGADNYSSTRERQMALGNESGLIKEWATQWGGDTYRTSPMECVGRVPWMSLHEADPGDKQERGAWANRGIVIRSWKARLGGKEAAPWIAERGLEQGKQGSSTLDFVPPPGVTRLEPGDFIEATIEHLIIPQFAKDYYGPNEALRTALAKDGNTWRMVHREAVGNDRQVEMKAGTLLRSHPAILVEASVDRAECRVSSGLGWVPVTFSGLTDFRGFTLSVDGRALDQSVHGKDFWQSDFDPESRTWSLTYNIPFDGLKSRHLLLSR